MSSVVLVLEFASTVASMAGASRILWSFARDRGLPYSEALKKVDRRTTVPVRAVIMVTLCSAAVGLINIGSTTAFKDVVSLVLEGFYASYLISCSVLLYHRLRGEITELNLDGKSPTGPFVWGPWRVPGWFGILNNIFAICYLITMMVFGFFPIAVPVTAETMNDSILFLGAVAIWCLFYYFVWARRHYSGPVIEVKLEEI